MLLKPVRYGDIYLTNIVLPVVTTFKVSFHAQDWKVNVPSQQKNKNARKPYEPFAGPQGKNLTGTQLECSIVWVNVTQAVVSVATTLESSRTGIKVVLFM